MILVVNSGSTSLKVSVVDEEIVFSGLVDGVGSRAKIKVPGSTLSKNVKDHVQAFTLLAKHLASFPISRVVHRVVHGGSAFSKPVKVSARVIKKLESFSALAPLHMPANLSCIRAAMKQFPSLDHIAVFDTAFHQTLPEHAYSYAVPSSWKKVGIRKYGFHGSSVYWCVNEMQRLLNKKKVSLIVCHLGGGDSVTAVKNNESLETSMGFSPVSGVAMATRSGDIDAEAVLFAKEHFGLSTQQVSHVLEKKSGLKALAGTLDMRVIFRRALENNEKAQFAIKKFSYDVAKEVGMFASLLGNVDALVFTGGIGEGAWYVRQWVADFLPGLGIRLAKKNEDCFEGKVSTPSSKIPVFVVPAKEELALVAQANDL